MPDSRRAALVGLVVIVLLIGAGLLISHVLRQTSKQQDCALSGRVDCTPELERANGRRPVAR